MDLTEKALEEKYTGLKNLGFFQFSEKKNTKAEIAELKQQQTSIQQNLQHLEETFAAQAAALEQELALMLEGLYREAKRKVPTTRVAQFLEENGNEEAAAALGDFFAAVENMG